MHGSAHAAACQFFCFAHLFLRSGCLVFSIATWINELWSIVADMKMLTHWIKIPFLFSLLLLLSCAQNTRDVADPEILRLEARAQNVTIMRDDFGVPHIYAKTDADAVFGLLYAQSEDDFNRVEQNYIWATGRLAEVEGEQALYSDVRARLYMTVDEARAAYESAPGWLQDLCDAFADGINYYLATHPQVKPLLLTRFESWMPMFFSEGSIGGDIEQIGLDGIRAFYGEDQTIGMPLQAPQKPVEFTEPGGSNGFAISGELTESGNAMLLINPHTSFFFRGEVHVVSDQGLNAYGAVTWGQFFVYQGFNENTGWMHTSTYVDFMDEFVEDVFEQDGQLLYRYGGETRPVQKSRVTLKYKDGDGMSERSFPKYHTHHGPVTHLLDNKWVVTRINWDPASDWQGLHEVDDIVTVLNPANGWIQNCNSTPFTSAGGFSPKREDYPEYMAPDPENFRALHAVRVLSGARGLTLDKLLDIAYDPYLPGFERLIPGLIEAYDRQAGDWPALAEPVEVLRNWDLQVAAGSVAMTLAHFYGDAYSTRAAGQAATSGMGKIELINYLGTGTPDDERLQVFAETVAMLDTDFGSWNTPWSEVNRYQRLNGDIRQAFNDQAPSLGVGMASGRWGALASFGAGRYPGTRRIYGTSGNSFVAVVEFGEKVRAMSMLAGGQSGDPDSPHFDDQAQRYIDREFKDVAYYREDVESRAQRTYHPGSITF